MRFGSALALLLLGVLALVLPNLGAAPLERAEIYFLDAARAMVETGDWLVPRYQGEAFFDKPPLAYWLMAAGFLGLGPDPGVARLVPALAALGAVLATAWLGVLLFDRRTALAGAVVLSTTLAFLIFARVAMSDMPLTLLTTLSVALAVRAYRSDPPGWTGPALGAVLGLGFATKGPIALLVPGLALVPLFFANRRRPLPFGWGALVAGIAAFVVLGLRLVRPRLRAARGGPPRVLLPHGEPGALRGRGLRRGAPGLVLSPRLRGRGPAVVSVSSPGALAASPEETGETSRVDAGALFLALGVALVLIPLVLSRGKIDYYLLPLYPAVSLLIGRLFVGVRWRRLERVWAGAVLVLLAGRARGGGRSPAASARGVAAGNGCVGAPRPGAGRERTGGASRGRASDAASV